MIQTLVSQTQIFSQLFGIWGLSATPAFMENSFLFHVIIAYVILYILYSWYYYTEKLSVFKYINWLHWLRQQFAENSKSQPTFENSSSWYKGFCYNTSLQYDSISHLHCHVLMTINIRKFSFQNVNNTANITHASQNKLPGTGDHCSPTSLFVLLPFLVNIGLPTMCRVTSNDPVSKQWFRMTKWSRWQQNLIWRILL